MTLSTALIGHTYWSRDGAELWVLDNDLHRLYVHDPGTGQRTRTLDLSQYSVPAFDLAPDQMTLIGQLDSTTLLLVDVISGDTQEIESSTARRLGEEIQAWHLSPHGAHLALRLSSGQYVLIDLARARERTIGSGTDLAWHPDERGFILKEDTETLTLWNAITGRWEYQTRVLDFEPSAPLWSPDGTYILALNARGNDLCMWIGATGHTGQCVTLPGQEAIRAAWNAAGDAAIVFFRNSHPRVYLREGDGLSGEYIEIAGGGFAPVAAIHPQRNLLALAAPPENGRAGPIRILDPTNGAEIDRLPGTYTDPVWSPDGQKLLVTTVSGYTSDGLALWWRTGLAVWWPDTLTDTSIAPTQAEDETASPVPPTDEAVQPPIANRDANLRSGPGTNYPVVGTVDAGAELTLVGRNTAGDWLQLAGGAWIAAFLVDGAPPDLATVAAPPTTTPLPVPTAMPAPTSTPAPPPSAPPATGSGTVVFDGDPRNSAGFCDGGFRSDCGFAGCGGGSRLVWGPFCRARDHASIKEPGLYRVTLYGAGRVIAGATDFGPTEERFTFGSQELSLPGAYTFCWPGLVVDGFGFETVVEGIDGQGRIDRIVVEYLGASCN